jgi:hypothetical protein
MIRPNGALIIKTLLLIVVLLSVLTIYGVAWNIPYFKLVGLIVVALSVILSIIFVGGLDIALLTFIVTLIPMVLNLSYELISKYPLGADVHSEYFVIKKMQICTQLTEIQKEAKALFGIPEYYSEILNLIFYSDMISRVLGIDSLYVIKFLWNSLILGLIPLVTFMYTYRLMDDKKSAVIASVLVFVQSTYIITLHSTVKHVISLFLAVIVILLVLRTLGWGEVRKDFPTLIILVTGLTGYHYLTSGIIIIVFFMSLALFYLVAMVFKSKSQSLLFLSRSLKTISYIVLFFILIWITWYFIMFQSIIKPIVDLITRLFTLEEAGYYYEKINVPLHVLVNIIRLGINGIIVISILVSGVLAFMNIKKGNIIDSLIAVSSVILSLGTVSELLGISTLGIGRVFLTLLIFVAPYFFSAMALIVHKLFGIFRNTAITTLLLVSLILATRLLISVGVIPYIFSDVKNSIFMNPNYKYITSLTHADLHATIFVVDMTPINNKIYIGSDYIGRIPFIYVCVKTCNITFVNYFVSLSDEKAHPHFIYLVFLSSYNVIGRTIQISVTEFNDLSEYLPHIKSANSLIYGNGFAYIFRLRGS